MKIRDRIKELRRVKASELVPNPKNWRTHPQVQQDALRGVLAEIGYADALLVRELPDGGLMLIDGHLRAETTPEQEVPVLVLDVDEVEADKILATVDPLAAMAEASKDKLDALLRDFDTNNEALQQMLTNLATDAGIVESLDEWPDIRPTTRHTITIHYGDEDTGSIERFVESDNLQPNQLGAKILERIKAIVATGDH